MSERELIPSDIRRQVRQRDGFGCVHCGSPVYDYEHFVEYSIVKEHRADNIYLLCLPLHRKKGKRVPRNVIDRWRKNPFNRSREETAPDAQWFSGPHYSLAMADSKLTITNGKSAAALVVEQTTLVGFTSDDGALLLNVLLEDEKGTSLLRIDQGELTMSTVENWDVDWLSSSLLQISQSLGDVSLRMRFDADRSSVQIESGQFHHRGRHVSVFPSKVAVDGDVISGQRSTNADIMLLVGEGPSHASVSVRCL